MSKKVLFIGHCGADTSYLRMAVRAADKGAQVVSAEDTQELRKALDEGVDLVLINRELGYGFDEDLGVELIRWLKPNYPTLRMMLVSNYPEAQADAVAAGAMPGFGKRELGGERVVHLLRSALAAESPLEA